MLSRLLSSSRLIGRVASSRGLIVQGLIPQLVNRNLQLQQQYINYCTSSIQQNQYENINTTINTFNSIEPLNESSLKFIEDSIIKQSHKEFAYKILVRHKSFIKNRYKYAWQILLGVLRDHGKSDPLPLMDALVNQLRINDGDEFFDSLLRVALTEKYRWGVKSVLEMMKEVHVKPTYISYCIILNTKYTTLHQLDQIITECLEDMKNWNNKEECMRMMVSVVGLYAKLNGGVTKACQIFDTYFYKQTCGFPDIDQPAYSNMLQGLLERQEYNLFNHFWKVMVDLKITPSADLVKKTVLLHDRLVEAQDLLFLTNSLQDQKVYCLFSSRALRYYNSNRITKKEFINILDKFVNVFIKGRTVYKVNVMLTNMLQQYCKLHNLPRMAALDYCHQQAQYFLKNPKYPREDINKFSTLLLSTAIQWDKYDTLCQYIKDFSKTLVELPHTRYMVLAGIITMKNKDSTQAVDQYIATLNSVSPGLGDDLLKPTEDALLGACQIVLFDICPEIQSRLKESIDNITTLQPSQSSKTYAEAVELALSICNYPLAMDLYSKVDQNSTELIQRMINQLRIYSNMFNIQLDITHRLDDTTLNSYSQPHWSRLYIIMSKPKKFNKLIN